MKLIYKIFSILFLLFLVLSYNHFSNNTAIELGSKTSNNVWIYLCGLTKDLNSPQEIANRNILNESGKRLNIKILAITPRTRCLNFDNKLCWPHNSKKETIDTYSYIRSIIKDTKISGFIGFSNGGFFLNKLAQILELNKPIISIGAAGYLADTKPNTIYLLIGQKDIYHFDDAHEFYRKSLGTPLKVKLIEHAGGHEISSEVFENMFIKLLH